MMRKRFLGVAIVSLFAFGIVLNGMPAYGKGSRPKTTVDTGISKIKLNAPATPELQAYLGVKKDSQFTINQLPASIVLIETLDVFCPDCQKNAPQMNRVYNIIENDPTLKSDIKIIGIAVGNDPKQIDTFVKEFKIQFPVFPDQDSKVHKLLGGIGPPGIILCDINGKVFYTHEGVVKDIDTLLGKIREAVKQK